jgi:hypothetical protein
VSTEDEGPRASGLGPPESAAPDPSPDARGPTPDAQPEEPILPNAYDDQALRDAIGPRKTPRARTEPSVDDDDEPVSRKRRRRTIMVAAATTLVGLAIAALIFLGRANASRYLLVCTAEHAAAEQGRAFPPWGSHALAGPEWETIALPPNAACKERETEEPAELARWYYDILVERASTTLTSRELLDAMPKAGAAVTSATPTNPLNAVSAQLEQALLLARVFDGADQRKEVERLQGDVEYWRATLRLRDASQAMADAAKQFDTASSHHPRHVDDAAAWGLFVRKLSDELHTGPGGAPVTIPNAAEPHAPAPPGTALPVEAPAAGSDVTPTPPAPPDAGLPGGGVLL